MDLTGCNSAVLSSRIMITGNCRFYPQSEHEFIGHGMEGTIAFPLFICLANGKEYRNELIGPRYSNVVN